MSDPTELGPTGHLTPEQLDELATQASADLDPDHPAVVSGPEQLLDDHLTGCPACRTALGDQIAVQGWLRRVPGPGPMPSDVVTRIDVALAAAHQDDQPVGTVLPIRAGSARTGLLARIAESRATKSLVAAAAVVAIGLGGYAAINRNGTSAGGDSSASSAKSGASGGVAAPDANGRGLDSAAPTVRASGTAYTTQNIADEVTKQLAVVPTQAAPTEARSSLGTPAGLRTCLAALGYPTVTPLLVDLATFNGKPVAVLVLPGDTQGRQIWVVSRSCAAGNDGTAYYAQLP